MSDAHGPRLPAPVVTLVIIAACTIVFAIELALGADVFAPTPAKMIALGGNLAPLTLGDEPWRLITAMFLHYGILHLAMNMYGLWAGGGLAERMYGRPGFIAIYLVAGLAGGVATVAMKDNVVSAGASGAIFGVFGAIGAWLVAHRERIDADALRAQSRGLLLFMGYNLVFGFTQKSIDMSAHIGGLLAGFGFGLALTWRSRGAHALARIAVATVVALAAIAGAVAALPGPAPSAQQDAIAALTLVEEDTNAALAQIADGAVYGSPPMVALADRLERELLPRWDAAGQRLRALPDEDDARRRRLQQAVRDYVGARREELAALTEVLRGRAEEASLGPLQQQRVAAEQAVGAAADALK